MIVLVKPWLKKDLGFDEDTPDEVVEKEWLRRTQHVCKPCWELKYCPYGPLVEQFPVYSTRQEMEEHIELLKIELNSGEFDKRVRGLIELSKTEEEEKELIKNIKEKLSSGKFSAKATEQISSIISKITNVEDLVKHMRKWAEEKIKSFNPEDYHEQVDYSQKCMLFGHYCPVFFVNEPFTETTEKRRITRDIPRAMLLRVIRRDNQTCQICGKNLMENEIAIDHIIPYSLGGPSEEPNLRVLCKDCNRKKGAAVEI